MLCVLPSTEKNFEIILLMICKSFILSKRKMIKKDKQKRPILVMRKKNRRFFRDIENKYFLFRKPNFFARRAFFTLQYTEKV